LCAPFANLHRDKKSMAQLGENPENMQDLHTMPQKFAASSPGAALAVFLNQRGYRPTYPFLKQDEYQNVHD